MGSWNSTVTITATAAATDNVNKGEATYKLTINKAKPTLTFANSTVSVKTTGSVNNPLTTVPKDLTVTYTSSDPKVATADETTGKVTLVDEGKATITATFAGDDYYNEASASYISIADRLDGISKDSKLSALLVEQLIERITVNGPEDIAVQFRFESGFERVAEVLEDA